MSATPAARATTVRALQSVRSTALVAALAALSGIAGAEDAPPADDATRRRLDQLEARVHELEQQQQQTPAAATPASTAPFAGLTFGAYGEAKIGVQQNPAANGDWQAGFDDARVTLQPTYRINDAMTFVAEIELEHGGAAFDDDDKLGGSVETEQAYLDIAIDEHLHWRPPGVDLVPVGYTNLYHEPTLFYSVERPELAESLVPSTWYAGATSVHGTLAGPFSYEFQVSMSLVDEGGNVRDIGEDRRAPGPTGYPAGIDGADGLGLAKAGVGDFGQVSDTLGYALRIAYDVPAVAGLAGSSSVYWTPDVEPRGAYASDAAGVQVGRLGHTGLAMLDSELRWRPADDGIELRGEGVLIDIARPAALRANNDGDAQDNVGRTMWGFSGEVAWHWRPHARWDVVPFYRYSREVLQTAGVRGRDAEVGDDAPTGAGDRQYHTVGVAVFPAPQVVLKIDYRAVVDRSADGPRSDHVLGGVGFFF